MIIYWSMVLWVPLIYFVYSLNHKEVIKLTDYNIQQGIQNKIPLAYAIIVFGYFVFWIGMRRLYLDTSSYITEFYHIPDNFSEAWSRIDWDGKNPGFQIFNILFKFCISSDYGVWLMAIAILCGVCILVVLRKYSVDFFFSAFLFVTLSTFFWMMNCMRQFICVTILFLCCDWIKDGKIVRFTIAVLLLSTIHITALIMIPIYFIARSKPWNKKIFFFIIGIILICIFTGPFFNSVENILADTAYEGSTEQFAEDDGVNPLRVLFYAVPPIIAFIKRKQLSKYYDKLPMLSICINMSLITEAFYLVGMFTSGILIGRLPIYSEVYNLILIPILLNVCVSKESRIIIKPIVIIVLLVYFYFTGPSYYHSYLTGAVY